MQCPACGYEADDAAIFCPHCRYQFRDISEEPYQAGNTLIDLPERGVIADESVLEETSPEERQKGFTDKEIRQLEVQLLQPAVLVVLIIALVTYTLLSGVPFVPVTFAGQNFSATGVLCLASGLIAGVLFFLIARRSLVRFRYR
jgi:hypothetical protein